MVLRKAEFTVINELWFDANENGNFEDNEKVISHNTQVSQPKPTLSVSVLTNLR
jgi:hypothetical protein